MTPHPKSIRSLVPIALMVVAAACGSSANEKSSPSAAATIEESDTTAAAADSAAATPETTATTTADTVADRTDAELEATDATTGAPEIIGSVTAETVAIPTQDADDPDDPDDPDVSIVESAAEELRDGVPTEKGKTYAIIDPSSGTGFSLVSSVDGLYPFLVINTAALSLDEEGVEGLISISALDRLRTFIDPNVDIFQIPPAEVEAATEPVADYLAWVGRLPGVTVGPIEETIVDGWPARSMTYSIGPSANGLPCDDTSLAGCLFTLWNPAGSTSFYPPNERGTLYEVLVDGSRALVDVTFRPGAQDIFETLHFLLGDG